MSSLSLHKLQEQITNLQKQLAQLTQSNHQEKVQEIFYQKYLEKVYGASHKTNTFGVTDIETDDCIIEIKSWNNYKSALGQLLSYRHSNKKHCKVYFFGDRPKKLDHIISIFNEYNIDVFHIYRGTDNTVVEEQLNNSCNEYLLFYTRQFLHKKPSNVLKWCDLYLHFVSYYDNLGHQHISKKIVKDYFERHVFKIKEQPIKGSRGWYGWDIVK